MLFVPRHLVPDLDTELAIQGDGCHERDRRVRPDFLRLDDASQTFSGRFQLARRNDFCVWLLVIELCPLVYQ